MTISAATVATDPQVAELTAQLEAALKRANVAEEQLRRVHAAVRAFKERQLAVQHAASVTAAAAAAAASASARPQAPQEWVAEDPSLDVRFQAFLNGEGDEDAARKWILAED